MMPAERKEILVQDTDEPTEGQIKSAIATFTSNTPMYKILDAYYKGRQAVPEDIDKPVIDNRCAYISDTLEGYIAGNTPQIVGNDDPDTQAVLEALDDMDFVGIIPDIIHQMSVYGRSFALMYLSDDGESIKCAPVSPLNAFVAYAPTTGRPSVFGAVLTEWKDPAGVTRTDLTIYTRTKVMTYDYTDATLQAKDVKLHTFGRVPLVEFSNSRYRLGDFESIISLQDASNFLLSYRQDDKESFSMATLIMVGQIMGMTREKVEEKLQNLRRTKVLQMSDGASATYLNHTFDETSIQTFQDRIDKAIFKDARVPDLSDESFASNSSGVAMAYKLLGTDTLAMSKIKRFNRAFTYVVKCIGGALNNPLAGDSPEIRADIKSMSVVFNPLTPQDIQAEAPVYATLVQAGLLSRETAISRLSIVEDVGEEMARIDADEAKSTALQRSAWEGDMTIQPDDEDTSEDM